MNNPRRVSSSVHARRSRIAKFFGSSDEEEEVSSEVTSLIDLRRKSREHVESLGCMIPITTEANNVDEAIACSNRPAVPLLPKAALLTLISAVQENGKETGETEENQDNNNTRSRRGSHNTLKSSSSNKSVNFDRVEILEFRDTDDTGIPDSFEADEGSKPIEK
ncbi:Oidioi.mRNA.OKI2018_I69.chr1.g1906.t1.cds [Oikopleura dioica]|uniref:Oidioi.mRNA.OKI2018_I69.chr1.g1906.t1.cds n=1 Tax=Oikopleura dioica TaxID=34765 RepID=A0ABN7STL4_OIKDI|nr:Oidioi.mRNA.OKI2018_I69.chr1.g1906.t1.cds [Oikopleura dioica]